MGIRQAILTRVQIAFGLVILLGVAIVFKIGNIQFAQGDKWRKLAEENALRFIEVEATRGNIMSDNGSLLATSLPFYRLAFDPTAAQDTIFEQNIDTLSFLLSGFFKESEPEALSGKLRQDRKEGRMYRVISRKLIPYKDTKVMREWPIFNQGRRLGGVIFEKVERRFKPYETLARRTIGFTRFDTAEEVSGRGLEFSFNKALAGKNGEALYQRMSGGKWRPVNDASQVRPEDGYDVQTTLDVDLQAFATESLEKALNYHQADYGCILVMEVETGEIKAMVNLGQAGNGGYAENYNYAVGSQGVTEPGSTFKLASVMALLEEADIHIDDSVNTGTGEYMFYEECVMTDATYGGYGQLAVQEVFEKSSNIGISKMAFRHFRDKPKKFISYLDKFHLTKPLGFQMVGEGVPFVNRPGNEGWSGCSLPWMSIGYELKLSPLHTLAFYNAIANEGQMITPIIVSHIRRGGRIIEEYRPRTLRKEICSEKTLFTLQGMLEGVVEKGTARNIRTEAYKIAGKTGTTQKIENGQYIKNYYTSFAGYFPADRPMYSAIVVIDNPKKDDQYGGEVAAPIFREISDWLYVKKITRPIDKDVMATASLPVIRSGQFEELERLSKEFGIKQVSHNTEKWVHTQVTNDTVIWVNNALPNEKVPDVRGMTLRDAIYVLENAGLQVKAFGNGRVKEQSISPGTKFRKGNRIFIRLG